MTVGYDFETVELLTMPQEMALKNAHTAGGENDFSYADPSSDDAETARLTEILYPELKRLAQFPIRKGRPDHTLQPTARVSDPALRFRLIDYARMRSNQQDGGRLIEIEFGDSGVSSEDPTQRTAKRDWHVARAWLFGRPAGDQDNDG